MSGTHGDPPESETQSGVSGLTDENKLFHFFYKEDCQLVGIVPGPNRVYLPVMTWEGIPDISKPAEVMESPPPGSFYDDEQLKRMDFRLANLSYYFGYTQKLMDDINEVKIVKQNLFN